MKIKKLIAFAFAVCLAAVVGPVGIAQAAPAGNTLPAGYTGGALSAGTYYLDKNTDLKSTMNVSGKVVLDLNGYVLRGNGKDVVINVQAGGNLTIKDSQPTLGHNGNVREDGIWYWEAGNYSLGGGIINNRGTGKGIDVAGTLTIEMGKIAGCYSSGIGAAVTVSSSGTFTMTGGQIIYNQSASSSNQGGAVYGEPSHKNSGSVISISNTLVKGNSSLGNGGGICGYNVTLNNCIIQDNSAKLDGGGVYVSQAADSVAGGKLTIVGCTFVDNSAANYGGGVYGATGSATSVSGASSFTGNVSLNGGAIYGSNISIVGTASKNVLFSGNAADRNGGAFFANEGLVVKHCTIDKNYAGTGGGGFYARCDAAVSDTVVSNNRAMKTETYGIDGSTTKIDLGRGGGIYFSGTNTTSPTCVLTDVEIVGNAAMYYGGGVQVCTNASLELVSGKISENEAVLHGAGGVHVTGSATFTLTGGEISGNIAHSVGGGIHSSYSCTLNLNGGEIKNNVTYGRGGGVHVNVGGNLLLQGTKITGNKAYDGTNMYSAKVTVDENNFATWSDVLGSGSIVKGYGGGVVIDAGTCTMTAGELSGNYAETGGGGIAFVMINTASSTRFGENKVVSFDFAGGSICDNTTDGNGGGIYLMKNSWTEEGLEAEYGWTIDGDVITDSDGKEIKLTDAGGNPASIQDIFAAIPYVKIAGGLIAGNVAVGNGGAAYLEQNTKFYINGGSMIGNEAVDGGAVYVAQGEAFINGGVMSENAASGNGGALFVNGDVTMTSGTIGGDSVAAANTAKNGGAIYVTGGNMTIEHGKMSYNSATTGGAVYMAGDSSTKFTMESGEMKYNQASDDGGAVYATGGNLYIGLLGCAGEGNDMHVAKGAGRHHPQITGNAAGDTGGGLAVGGAGSVYLYCGDVVDNDALYKGVGYNVFMNGGKVYLHEGADVGTYIDSKLDPDLVIVGGELVEGSAAEGGFVKLKYYQSNAATSTDKEGKAELGMRMNLPDGIYFFNAPQDGYMFFGWTPKGAASAQKYVRDKEEYIPSGAPVTVTDSAVEGGAQGTFDGAEDSTMNLYALWAPPKSKVTYAGYVTEDGFSAFSAAQQAVNPAEYSFTYGSNVVSIKAPEYSGYELVGWYIYQDEGQNANWGKDYEPAYLGGEKSYANLDLSKMKYVAVTNADDSLDLEMGESRFGDVTLIAKYEPVYGTVTISKAFPQGASYSVDADQPFVFRITGEADDEALPEIDMAVVVCAGGSVTVTLPAGDYTVAEDASWSWRYSCDDAVREVSLDVQGDRESLSFVNEQANEYWLNFIGMVRNAFRPSSN